MRRSWEGHLIHAQLQGAHLLTVLVIEDGADIRLYIEDLITTAGYEVRSAMSGAEADAEMAAHLFDAILLDRRLPDVDGVDLCRHLRQSVDRSVSNIMITADRSPMLETDARAAGVTHLLRKPFLPPDLLALLPRNP